MKKMEEEKIKEALKSYHKGSYIWLSWLAGEPLIYGESTIYVVSQSLVRLGVNLNNTKSGIVKKMILEADDALKVAKASIALDNLPKEYKSFIGKKYNTIITDKLKDIKNGKKVFSIEKSKVKTSFTHDTACPYIIMFGGGKKYLQISPSMAINIGEYGKFIPETLYYIKKGEKIIKYTPSPSEIKIFEKEKEKARIKAGKSIRTNPAEMYNINLDSIINIGSRLK